MQKFLILGLLIGVYCNPTRSDIQLIDSNDRRFLLYESEGNVIWAKCPSNIDRADRRSCHETEKPIGLAEFSRNLNSFYGIPGGFGGKSGFSALSISIEKLQEEIGETPPPQKNSEINKANESQLKKLVLIQRKLIRLHGMIYSKLVQGEDSILSPSLGISIDSRYDPERIKRSLGPLWFDGADRVWSLASIAADFVSQSSLCGAPFTVAFARDFTEGTIRGLQNSPLNQLEGKTLDLVWTADPLHYRPPFKVPGTEGFFRTSAPEEIGSAISLKLGFLVTGGQPPLLAPGSKLGVFCVSNIVSLF